MMSPCYRLGLLIQSCTDIDMILTELQISFQFSQKFWVERRNIVENAMSRPLISNYDLLMTESERAPLPAAADPEPKEDFCIADRLSRVHVNGYVCKDRSKVSNEDFVPSSFSSAVTTLASASEFPGLNTQGLTTGRVDFEPSGINLPHWHPRASEILMLLQGELYVAFVDAQHNRLRYNTLQPGDIYDVLQRSFNLTKSEVKRLKRFFETHDVVRESESLKACVEMDHFSVFAE
uniref:Cupin type-1 domain-containing protein n=1 Tax=Physcomitrium patens TaxID=3218 RepID=A0A2K1IUP7_PHYPA|nr:hypothetical protein PHYPA_024946 [Physcomitrium patens]